MISVKLLLVAVAALGLSACAYAQPTAEKSPALPAPAAAGDVGPNSGGTYPYGSAPAPADSAAPAAPSATFVGPSGNLWLKPGTTNERYADDADDCYSYALAQISHDAQIESDADSAYGDRTGNIASTALRQRMSQFGREQRLPRLFGQCMEAKGYTRG